MTDVDNLKLIDSVKATVTIFAGDVFIHCECGQKYQMNWRVLQHAAREHGGREIVCGSCSALMFEMKQPL